MGKIISVAQHKGGVGKTTSVLNLAATLSKMGSRVLVVDVDVQANLTYSVLGEGFDGKGLLSYLMNPKDSPSYSIVYESRCGFDIIPNEKRINGRVFDITNLLGDGLPSFLRIENLLKEDQDISSLYDYILIDLPPSKDKVVMNAMMVSDFYLIPIEASDYCMDGLQEMIKYISEAQGYNKKLQLLGMFMPNVDMRLKSTKDLIDKMKDKLGESYIDVSIPTNTAIKNLPSQGKTILDLAGRSAKGKKEYEELAKEIIRRCEMLSEVSEPNTEARL